MKSLDAKLELLTARDRGAIAVLRVCGTDAVLVADSVFRAKNGVPLARTPRNRLRVGRAGLGFGDEVVAAVLDEVLPTAEFQCHGGTLAVEMVSLALLEAGARWIGDSADESVLDARARGLEAQALDDLSQATTLATAQILLEQAQGALRAAIVKIVASFDDNPLDAVHRLTRLIDRGSYGLRLLSGWRVVLAGRPNVGKSRLLNALAGYERAIVDPTPGTTRDAVAIRAALGGWPVEIVDTAGLRESRDVIEREGVARSRAEHRSADLILIVLDRSTPLEADDLILASHREDGSVKRLLVANKADLPAAWAVDPRWCGIPMLPLVSAEFGTGLDDLIAAIIDRLVPSSPAAGTGVPFRGEQVDVLTHARALALNLELEDCRRRLESLLG